MSNINVKLLTYLSDLEKKNEILTTNIVFFWSTNLTFNIQTTSFLFGLGKIK
jgi:hypothetical protein